MFLAVFYQKRKVLSYSSPSLLPQGSRAHTWGKFRVGVSLARRARCPGPTGAVLCHGPLRPAFCSVPSVWRGAAQDNQGNWQRETFNTAGRQSAVGVRAGQPSRQAGGHSRAPVQLSWQKVPRAALLWAQWRASIAQQNFQRLPHSLQTTKVVMGSSELRVCTCV